MSIEIQKIEFIYIVLIIIIIIDNNHNIEVSLNFLHLYFVLNVCFSLFRFAPETQKALNDLCWLCYPICPFTTVLFSVFSLFSLSLLFVPYNYN